MYLKLIPAGLNLSGGTGGYATFDTIDIYDSTNKKLSLTPAANVVLSSYSARNTVTSQALWFNGIYGVDKLVPYNNYSEPNATVILNLGTAVTGINKLTIESYSNTGGAKYIDIYYSIDNVTYTYSGRVTFTTILQTINYTTPMIAITSKYLIKCNNTYYSVKSAYYDINAKTYTPLALTGATPTVSEIKTYGFDNVSDIITALTLNGETFKPIDKLLTNFNLKAYIVKV